MAGFQEVEYFDGKATQCYLVSNEKYAVVAFRGSEAKLRDGDSNVGHIFADWMANFNFAPEPWEQGGKVHRGFKGALDEIWDDLEEHISYLQKNNRKIWMTGHSLGAALATLAADRYGNVQGCTHTDLPVLETKISKKILMSMPIVLSTTVTL